MFDHFRQSHEVVSFVGLRLLRKKERIIVIHPKTLFFEEASQYGNGSRTPVDPPCPLWTVSQHGLDDRREKALMPFSPVLMKVITGSFLPFRQPSRGILEKKIAVLTMPKKSRCRTDKVHADRLGIATQQAVHFALNCVTFPSTSRRPELWQKSSCTKRIPVPIATAQRTCSTARARNTKSST